MTPVLRAGFLVLDEDEETGAQRYKYIRTATDHYSLAFTYGWLAAQYPVPHQGLFEYMRGQIQRQADGSG